MTTDTEPAAEPDARPPYASAIRSSQAQTTRRAIVTAAADLFVEQGYAATTIDAIAARAGVGRKTVFSSVGGKGALLRLAWDWTLVGDDEPIPMSARPAVQAMLAEQDPARLVRMWVAMLLDVGERVNPLGGVVLAAADVDSDARALRDLIRRETRAGATAFVSHLAATGGLRTGVSIERGADGCWALVNSLLFHLLVNERGWSTAEYGDWLTQVVAALLLAPGHAQQAQSQPQERPEPHSVPCVVDDPDRERYEATIDGRVVGQLAYERTERLTLLTRTRVHLAVDDRGVADSLTRRALDDVRAEGTRRVVALCSYVQWWVEQHPEYASLVLEPATS